MKEIRMKVIVAGEPGSGKSVISEVTDACIPLKQFGVSLGVKTMDLEDTKCQMAFTTWTLTDGRPKDTSYYKGSKAAVIVCDLTKGNTVVKMKTWADSIIKRVGRIPLVFVGNNVDSALGNNVDLMLKLAESYHSPVVFTRLGDRKSVEMIFDQIVKAVGPDLLDAECFPDRKITSVSNNK
jgi:nucleoside-triphosphatase THEP1